MPGQVGLAILSLVLGLGAVCLVRYLARDQTLILRGLTALFLFWVFVWASPQIYYGYYLLILDGLPVQLVVGAPPSLKDLVDLLFFSARNNLSLHGQAVLGWAMILAALWSQRLPARVR